MPEVTEILETEIHVPKSDLKSAFPTGLLNLTSTRFHLCCLLHSLGSGLRWFWERSLAVSIQLGACRGPSLSNGRSQLCHFHLCWQTRSSSSAGSHWVEIGMLRGGEELNVASCDLHNKIRRSPMALSCLLIAVLEGAPLGTASLKGLSGAQRGLRSNVQLNWWDQFIRIKTSSASTQ